jgi:hypothetical protein
MKLLRTSMHCFRSAKGSLRLLLLALLLGTGSVALAEDTAPAPGNLDPVAPAPWEGRPTGHSLTLRERIREQLRQMPPERRALVQERWKAMTPEERARLRDRMLNARPDMPAQDGNGDSRLHSTPTAGYGRGYELRQEIRQRMQERARQRRP